MRSGRILATWRATSLKKTKNRVEQNAGSSFVTTVPSASAIGFRQFAHWQVSRVSSMLMEMTFTDDGMSRIFSSTLFA